MISKEQFLTIKRLKQEGVPIAAIARRIGISEPTTRKWANMSEAGFDELKKDDIPYLDNYREFILSILRVCPQTRETNILYRLREEFPDFECRKTTFYKYMRSCGSRPDSCNLPDVSLRCERNHRPAMKRRLTSASSK